MKSSSLWIIALLPWLLEILCGTRVFNTLLGSTLWTLILVLAVLRQQIRDPRLRKGLLRAKWLLAAAWMIFWTFAFIERPPADEIAVGISKFWIQTHVALLTAGLASVLTLLVSSFLWFLQELRLRSDSWQRRGQALRLPSLESLSRVSHLSALFAFVFWSGGSLLAAATLLLSARTRELATLGSLLLDDQILGVAAFWMILGANYFITKNQEFKAKAYRSYLFFSLIFLLSFVLWTLVKDSNFHSPLRWLFA